MWVCGGEPPVEFSPGAKPVVKGQRRSLIFVFCKFSKPQVLVRIYQKRNVSSAMAREYYLITKKTDLEL